MKRCWIRELRIGDIEIIFSLMKANMHKYYETRKEQWNEAKQRHFFMEKSACVMCHDDTLIGFSFYEINNQALHIHTLQVAANHQDRWVGYHFLRWYLKKAYEVGFHRIGCGVYEINPALALYLRLGFSEVAREDGIIKLSLSLKNNITKNIFYRAAR